MALKKTTGTDHLNKNPSYSAVESNRYCNPSALLLPRRNLK